MGQPPAQIRVFICDDSQPIRIALHELLADEPGIEIVGEAATAAGALERLVPDAPDVVLLDINLPDRAGLGVIAELMELRPAVRVIVLTGHQERSYLRAALDDGARGFLLKESTFDHLATAIHEVVAGRTFVDPWFD